MKYTILTTYFRGLYLGAKTHFTISGPNIEENRYYSNTLRITSETKVPCLVYITTIDKTTLETTYHTSYGTDKYTFNLDNLILSELTIQNSSNSDARVTIEGVQTLKLPDTKAAKILYDLNKEK